MISNGQYKCFILLLTHFSQQSLRFISIRSYLLISPLTHDWNYSISLSLSLSLYLSHSPLMFVLLLILFVICIRYAWNIFFLVFILFSFCSSVIVGYAPMYEWRFLPSSFNYFKQSNGEYIQACWRLYFIVTSCNNWIWFKW